MLVSAPNSPSPLVFDISAAAPLIGASERWLADKLRAGAFPGHKVARRWMLTEDDLREILRICAVPTAAPVCDTANLDRPQVSSMTRMTARRLRRGDP